jgi:mannose/fructose/sorbose-specific phosphotransferase system IIA component
MNNLVIVSHGELAAGLFDALRILLGDQEGIVCISLQENDPPEDLINQVEAAVQDLSHDAGVLLLVDTIGAETFQAAIQFADYPNIEIITGFNLPMLLEAVLQRDKHTIRELALIAREAGMNGILVAPAP